MIYELAMEFKLTMEFTKASTSEDSVSGIVGSPADSRAKDLGSIPELVSLAC